LAELVRRDTSRRSTYRRTSGSSRDEQTDEEALLDRRVYDNVKVKDGQVYAAVLSTDMKAIKGALNRKDAGTWQNLFREIIGDLL
jgi:hypothetical protein